MMVPVRTYVLAAMRACAHTRRARRARTHTHAHAHAHTHARSTRTHTHIHHPPLFLLQPYRWPSLPNCDHGGSGVKFKLVGSWVHGVGIYLFLVPPWVRPSPPPP